MIQLQTPLTKDKIATLSAGDMVYISGVIYTARDAAHKRLCEMIEKGETLPFDLQDACIYYVGPTPTPPNRVIGSAGPTTSMRMDAYATTLYDLGVSVSIGKGYRSDTVVKNIKSNKAIYMVAIGGAGALLSACIKKAEVIAFADLGAEAIHRLEVESFPVSVAIDSKGVNVYE